MPGRNRRFLAALAIVLLLAAAGLFRLSPLWPGPAVPAGATRLALTTAPAHLIPTFGCPAAALAPARIAVRDDELVLVPESGGEPLRVVWPSGWMAWRLDSKAQLVARDGRLIGNEGALIEGFGGGLGTDDAFHVCEIGA